jgi:hypothetical protein
MVFEDHVAVWSIEALRCVDIFLSVSPYAAYRLKLARAEYDWYNKVICVILRSSDSAASC